MAALYIALWGCLIKPESLFRRRVRKWIETELDNCVLMSIQQVSICGSPDFILCLNGEFVALELKTEDGRVSELQKYKLEQIIWKGHGTAYVVDPESWPEIQKKLLTIDRGDPFGGKKE